MPIALSTIIVHLIQVDAAQQHQQSLNNALLNAIPSHHIADVRNLLRLGADPNCQEQPASLRERVQNSPFVVRHFTPTYTPNLYMTPLGMAALNCEPDTVQALLDAGADVKQKDSYGETALDVVPFGEDKIAAMLKAANMKQNKSHVLKDTAIERGR